jgi:hypothetical protein
MLLRIYSLQNYFSKLYFILVFISLVLFERVSYSLLFPNFRWLVVRDTDATVRAYQRMVAGEASDLYASDTYIWTATSQDLEQRMNQQ